MVGVGQRIGNYRVQRKLGQGGMGAVFEVVHEEIGRRAAVKVLLQDFAKDKGSIQRFFNEARAVNIIHHPSLVGVFESGRLEDGSAFIIMEYLDGELLSSRLKRVGTLSHLGTLSLGRQIASALAAAHGKGIVHRGLTEHPFSLRVRPFSGLVEMLWKRKNFRDLAALSDGS